MLDWILSLSCSRAWLMTVTCLAVDVCDHEVTTAVRVTTVHTSFVHRRGVGVQTSAATRCTATEVSEKKNTENPGYYSDLKTQRSNPIGQISKCCAVLAVASDFAS